MISGCEEQGDAGGPGIGYIDVSDLHEMNDGSSAVDTLLGLVSVLWIPCGIYAGVIAASKEHNWFPWILGGLLFGPVALIATAGLPDRRLTRYIRLINEGKSEPSKEIGSVTREQSLKPSDLR